MSQASKDFDILVIGGGISGLGIATEAARQGFKTALIDKTKICSKTSANSLRIIHGGYRYLQTLSFARIRDSIQSKDLLLKKYPDYICELPCIFPLNKSGLKSSLPVRCANIVYGLFEKIYTGRVSGNKVLPTSVAEERCELLKDRFPYGALLWFDAYISDLAGFHKKLREEYLALGGEIRENFLVKKVHQAADGLEAIAESDGAEIRLSSKYIINSLGPWVDSLEVDLPGYSKHKHQWCKAFNLVLNRKLPTEYAVGVENKTLEGQKRLFFITQREGKSVVGTAYTPLDCELDHLTVSEKEKSDFLAEVNQALPRFQLQISDIDKVDVGVLPVDSQNQKNIALTAKEQIYSSNNYLEFLSIKYTTFPIMPHKILKELL